MKVTGDSIKQTTFYFPQIVRDSTSKRNIPIFNRAAFESVESRDSFKNPRTPHILFMPLNTKATYFLVVMCVICNHSLTSTTFTSCEELLQIFTLAGTIDFDWWWWVFQQRLRLGDIFAIDSNVNTSLQLMPWKICLKIRLRYGARIWLCRLAESWLGINSNRFSIVAVFTRVCRCLHDDFMQRSVNPLICLRSQHNGLHRSLSLYSSTMGIGLNLHANQWNRTNLLNATAKRTRAWIKNELRTIKKSEVV